MQYVQCSYTVKCVADKNKPPEANGLKLSNETFTIFTHSRIFMNAGEEMRQKL